MKILMAITTLGPGGAERILAVLAEEYRRRGHSVTVVCLEKPPQVQCIPDMLRKQNVKIIYLNIRKTDPLMIFKIRRTVKAVKPDVVHTHLMHPNLLFRIAMTGLNLPLVNTIHISERRAGKNPYFLLDGLTRFLADKVTAVSFASAQYHEKVCHYPTGSIRVIRNGSDSVPPPAPGRVKALSTLWHLGDYNHIAGSIGRLDKQKGYDILLSRISALATRIPENEKWLLLILGDGPERAALQKMIARVSIPRLNVKLGGFQPDAASLMSLFDVFLMPSRYEGYGLALTEAMSLGLPVVCSDADSLPELCREYKGFSRTIHMSHDRTGSILADSIAEAIAAGRSQGQIIQSNNAMAEEYLSLYQQILGGQEGKTC